MKKHSGGEKSGLIPEYWKSSSLIISFFFFFTFSVNSQVLINGFCKFNTYEIPPGFNYLAGTNLIEHPQNKLILYSPDRKEICIQLNDENGDNLIFNRVPFNFEISKLLSFTGKTKKLRHVFTSRKRRILGTFELDSSSTPQITATIEFDTYPENLDIADVDLKGTYEFLVSGSGFDGISVIYQQGETFTESKIISGESFNFAGFTNVDNDGYIDIVAQNIYEDKLLFFINDGTGRYKIKKTINLKSTVNSIKFSDLNNDGFGDIIYSDDISVTIIYGDFASSYQKRKNILTQFSPDELLVSDYNNDGLPDISYLNKSQGLIVLLFARKNGEFDEVVYCRADNLNDSAIIKMNGRKGVAAISGNGKLIMVTSLDINDFSGNINIVPSVNPVSIGYFKNEKTRYDNFCFLDEFDNQLKLLLNNKDGIPDVFYSVPVAEIHSKILTDEFLKDKTWFYCYTPGSRLFEIVSVDLKNMKFDRQPMYSPGNILDIYVDRKDKDLAYIYIAYIKSSRGFLGRFEYKTLSTTFKEFPFFDKNVLDAKIVKTENPILYYWKEEPDTLLLKRVEMVTGPNIYNTICGLGKYSGITLQAFNADPLSKAGDRTFSYFKYDNGNSGIITENKIDYFSFPDIAYKIINVNNKNSADELRFNYHSGFLTVYYQPEKSFYRIEYRNSSSPLNKIKLLDAEDAGDYFIEQIDEKNLRIVFINKSEGCISSDKVISQ